MQQSLKDIILAIGQQPEDGKDGDLRNHKVPPRVHIAMSYIALMRVQRDSGDLPSELTDEELRTLRACAETVKVYVTGESDFFHAAAKDQR